MDEKLINRINELAKKSRETNLTKEELKEQQELRGQYIMAFRNNLTSQLNNIDIKNPDGSVVSLNSIRKKKNNVKH